MKNGGLAFLLFFVLWSLPVHGAELNMTNRSQALRDFFNRLNKDTMYLVGEFYDANVDFQDPVTKVHGVEGMKAYYGHQYQNVDSIRFAVTNEVVQGDTHVFIWTMHLKSSKIDSGKEITVDGNSVITFGGPEGKAIYHRDYFDMGEFIYERVPVLGYVIKKIKKQLAAN